MDQDLTNFLQELTTPDYIFNERSFFAQAGYLLQVQLQEYLNQQECRENSFYKSVCTARKLNNADTDKKFWQALLSFDSVLDSFVMPENKSQRNCRKWLRFVNMIENLQGYNGSQLFSVPNLYKKQQVRLYFAVMLTWEHLRYIAGNDDQFSPSSEILGFFASDVHSHEHTHEDCGDNCDHQH
ncbi:hypothetical protein [Psychromonas ossibalaenae]|uniref:hypothetical protein n=1 Tax=Psychromonas ossibalaenae TaxID=444922 RepID=UPI000365F021|nr:hypothetical protein [Psychromonas ossibalaenae]